MLGYLLIVGAFFLLFYVLLRKVMSHRKIQLHFPKNKDYVREIGYSIVSGVIFVSVPNILMGLPAFRLETAYHHFGHYFQGWGYLLVFFPIMLILHDTYFYWTHRMMHHRWLFRWFHRVHHRSHNPSPWASFSFSPLEAFVQVGIGPILMLAVPINHAYINIFFVFSLLCNVYGHLGFELLPKGFNKHWLGRWLNTAVHHDLHHQEGKNSYGLYLTAWDRIMGTMNKGYDQKYAKVTQSTNPVPLTATTPVKGAALPGMALSIKIP